MLVRYRLTSNGTVIHADVVPIRIDPLPASALSLGLSELQGGAGQVADMEALIGKADVARYRAKQRGRNWVEAWLASGITRCPTGELSFE
ncbi:MAG: hypothetical protein IPI44_02670 [Sulfuritalea sp.]|nr:hypothetical protein [Sulfuritalea sp.]